ncbi:hypothetical protein J4468_02240 [Candidatus Woesearchaeota archaeon]|nr:hypothetical protein [Candidatus Woesearchaeota archaeon]
MTKKEVIESLVIVLFLTLFFGFNDGRETFVASYWFANLLRIFVIVMITFMVHVFGHKVVASIYGATVTTKNWAIQRYWITQRAHLPIAMNFFGARYKINSLYIGVVIGIIVTLISNGKFWFAGLESQELSIDRFKRLGKGGIAISKWEVAKIAIAGSMANVILIFLLGIFNSSGIFDKFILIGGLFAIYSMFPLPGLDGNTVYFESKPLYIFGFCFIVLSFFLLQFLTAGATLFMTLLLTFVIGTTWFYFRMFK